MAKTIPWVPVKIAIIDPKDLKVPLVNQVPPLFCRDCMAIGFAVNDFVEFPYPEKSPEVTVFRTLRISKLTVDRLDLCFGTRARKGDSSRRS